RSALMFTRALPIADAVLFEGYLLYPYRASSTKNQLPFSFGTLLPVGPSPYAGSERSDFFVEAIALGAEDVELRALVRFFELAPAGDGVTRGAVREVALAPMALGKLCQRATSIDIRAGRLRARASLSAKHIDGGARISLHVENTTEVDEEGAAEALAR